MIEPKIDDLLAAVDSKYTLVILAAKRAREINSYYSQLGEGRGEFVPPLVESGGLTQQAAVDRPRRDRRGQDRLRASRGDRRGRLTCPAYAAAGCCSASRGGIAAYKAAFARPGAPGRGRRRHAVLTASATRFVGADTFAALTGNPAYASLWDGRRRGACTSDLAHDADVAGRRARHGQHARQARARPRRRPAHLDAARVPTARWWSRRRCTPGCGASPATQANVATLAARGVRFVGPVEGALAARRRRHRAARRARGHRGDRSRSR